jgi:hypothetical protein
VFGERAFGQQVELEPARRGRLVRHLLHADRRCGRQNEHRAGRSGAAGSRALALATEEFVAPERGDHDRRLTSCAKDADAGVDSGNVVEHARSQAQPPPGGDVVGKRDLVISACYCKGIGAGRERGTGFVFERVEIGAIQVPLLRLPAWRPQRSRYCSLMPGVSL